MERVFIKKYWLREEIGRTVHSIVYHAIDSESEKDVAIKKLITPSLLLNIQKEDAIRNFLKEIDARRSFYHPNVIELYDCFEHENEIFFVEEFADGKSLDVYMNDGRYYTDLFSGLYIFQKGAEALLQANKHAYCHRNLKPENLIVTRDNSLKITDFTICSFLYREQKVRTSLDSDRYENLTLYVAPETVNGSSPDERSNVFSLGVIMYEFFTGIHPFQGRTKEETYENILQKVPHQALVLNPSIPELVNYIINKAIKKDPQERYGGFKEFLQDLEYFYQQGNQQSVRIDLYHSRKLRATLLSTKAVTRRFISVHSRKLFSFSSAMVRKMKKVPSSELFIGDELDPSKISKKKVVLEESSVPIGETSAIVTEREVELSATTSEEAYSIRPSSKFNPGSPIFYLRGSFIKENKIFAFRAAVIFLFVIVAAFFAAIILYYSKTGNTKPVLLPTKVTANTGNAGLMVKCNIGEAEIEVIPTGSELPSVKGRLNVLGEWEVNGIASGPYSVIIKKDGYFPYIGSVTLKDNDSYLLTTELVIRIPSLDINTEPPGATVKLDDSVLGTAPFKVYELKPGECFLIVELSGYETYKEKVMIGKNETVTRKITLDKIKTETSASGVEKSPSPSVSPSSLPSPQATEVASASLSIESVPDVATVYLDDKEIGTTPLKYNVSPFRGKVAITLKKKNYRDWKDVITLIPGEKREIFADLAGTTPIAIRTPGIILPDTPAKEAMRISYNVFYSKCFAYDKLSRKRLMFDFDRERVDQCIKKFVDLQLENARGKGGSFKLDVIFAVQMETGNNLAHPLTYLVGAFQIIETRKNKILFEESESREFSYDTESFMIEDVDGSYNTYAMANKSIATEEAIKMFNRFVPRFEQIFQRGQ